MLVSILENGRHLGFLIGPSGRIDLVTIEMPYANFGACITICTIHPKNACYLLHHYRGLESVEKCIVCTKWRDIACSIDIIVSKNPSEAVYVYVISLRWQFVARINSIVGSIMWPVPWQLLTYIVNVRHNVLESVTTLFKLAAPSPSSFALSYISISFTFVIV